MPRRLAELERIELAGVRAYIASARRARLLGLALLPRLPPGVGLLFPRCRSVHTAAMRFSIDLVWFDERGRIVRVDRHVAPWRLVACRRADAVLELAAGAWDHGGVAEDRPAREPRRKLAAGLDPRQRIYRDPFNESFVLVLSATGAAVVAPLVLYAAMALTDTWPALTFLVAAVVFELVLIFGVGRPQMKPLERLGWAVLWGSAAAGLALCFYHLVARPTL